MIVSQFSSSFLAMIYRSCVRQSVCKLQVIYKSWLSSFSVSLNRIKPCRSQIDVFLFLFFFYFLLLFFAFLVLEFSLEIIFFYLILFVPASKNEANSSCLSLVILRRRKGGNFFTLRVIYEEVKKETLREKMARNLYFPVEIVDSSCWISGGSNELYVWGRSYSFFSENVFTREAMFMFSHQFLDG